ncbi:hypothetical protein ACFOZ7_03930 [Natribaculum luteum]|uniref:Uncharacterized protein n=1 Tax=Natribaculum luteum TaxID=1586232 RepID=A0ABD5NWV1_9EURY|nr:hypothetical protein [Natribaculum luteum]
MSRTDALALRDRLSSTLACEHEFSHTVGCHREDGTYVVERRRADSSGHRKVFESFEQCRRLYDRLPDRFTATDVGRAGLTGSRRHLLVRHFDEHPDFECELVARQPLTVHKRRPERN